MLERGVFGRLEHRVCDSLLPSASGCRHKSAITVILKLLRYIVGRDVRLSPAELTMLCLLMMDRSDLGFGWA